MLGYKADELGRMERAEGYSTSDRQFDFPLVTWEWSRRLCEVYVAALVGETWRKSCCVFCPFVGGEPDILARYREFPAEATDALFLEHVSMSVKPRMSLYASISLRSVLEAEGNAESLRLFQEKLDALPWAGYRARRIIWTKGRADRKTEG